jgi:flagellar basal-body rod modification protein FlgD
MISPIGSEFDFSVFGPPEAAPEDAKLGQEEFLKLMITQLENQDPFKPLESGEFLGQLAQFGTVSGLSELQTSFDGLATSLVSNQALQAAGLIGRPVLVAGSQGLYEPGGTYAGAVDLDASSSSVRLQINDASGQVVRQIELGAQSAGLVRFQWDGITDAGVAAEQGLYSVSAQYFDGAEMRSTGTLIKADVESVTLGAQGLAVQLRGLGVVPFSAVAEIG